LARGYFAGLGDNHNHKKGFNMRLLTKSDINARAVVHRNPDFDLVVRMRCGALWYELQPGEAADLARELLSAANAVIADKSEQPENHG
jgi:hypothetical protein